MEHITSLKNPKVAAWKALKDRKGRRESGCFLVEGRKMVEEALASAFDVETVLVQEGMELPDGLTMPVYELPAHVLTAVCDTKTPQGIAAVVRMKEQSALGKHIVVLDGVQDPGNVGTIIRTADAAGFDGAILGPGCADLYGAKTLRATMGSVFRVPVLPTNDLPGTLEAMKREGYAVAATELGGQDFYACCPRGKAILVIGSEGQGISKPVRDAATHHLALPMRGGAESLNAAVAAGIMIYEMAREQS